MSVPSSFLSDLIYACVMECYFHKHMEERNLLVIEDLAGLLEGYDPNAGETGQRKFVGRLCAQLTSKDSMFQDRLQRIVTDSSGLLAVIKQDGET